MRPIKWDGTPIGVDGWYEGIPSDAYHDKLTTTPSVSSTVLRVIESQSPAHAWATSPWNDWRRQRPHNKTLDFGRAAHALLLNDGSFDREFVISPYDSYRTKEARAWRDTTMSTGITIITEDDYNKIVDMSVVLSEMPEIKSGLLHGYVETSFIWKDETTDLWFKSRPDCLTIGGAVYGVDYKTSSSVSMLDFERTTVKYGYAMQAAMMNEGAKVILGTPLDGVIFIAQETSYPYIVSPFVIAPEWIEWGRLQCVRAAQIFRECYDRGEWPAYLNGFATLSPPEWLRARLQSQVDSGEL